MGRSPFQVLIYPYRWRDSSTPEYALLQRADLGWWQGVAGGGEAGEQPEEAARRETAEELRVAAALEFVALDTMVWIPAPTFRDSSLWGPHVYVIPQYCFGVLLAVEEIHLSTEHTAYQWLRFEEAQALVNFDGNKTALWELNERLRQRNQIG